jgi:hypothetical protein
MDLEIKKTLDLLSFYLEKKGVSRTFIICGGASLILQGIVSRGTKDIDIVGPKIDSELEEAAVYVANQLGLNPNWLNTEPKGLARDMTSGWKKRIFEVYNSSCLIIHSISREDMIFAKFYAYCDRQKDLQDLIDLKITKNEVEIAAQLTEQKDAHPLWPKYVKEQELKLKQRLGYED